MLRSSQVYARVPVFFCHLPSIVHPFLACVTYSSIAQLSTVHHANYLNFNSILHHTTSQPNFSHRYPQLYRRAAKFGGKHRLKIGLTLTVSD